tara:strand:- start:9761 stop:10165 length:405 start_codon:yes stop_codon:yes gene_type:complete
MKLLLSLLLIFPLIALASDCNEYKFDFYVEQVKQRKELSLCPINVKNQRDLVSPACLNSMCKQLKPRKITLPSKRKGVKAHPSLELCKSLNGQYISGQLSRMLKQATVALCFFNDGNVISSGYLYSSWKKHIRR